MGVLIKGQCPRCKGHIIEIENLNDRITSDGDICIFCVLCGRSVENYPRKFELPKFAKEWKLSYA